MNANIKYTSFKWSFKYINCLLQYGQNSQLYKSSQWQKLMDDNICDLTRYFGVQLLEYCIDIKYRWMLCEHIKCSNAFVIQWLLIPIPPLHGQIIAIADEPTDSSTFWNRLVDMWPGYSLSQSPATSSAEDECSEEFVPVHHRQIWPGSFLNITSWIFLNSIYYVKISDVNESRSRQDSISKYGAGTNQLRIN